VVLYCFTDLGLRRIQGCTVLHRNEVIVSSLFVMSRTLRNVIYVIALSSRAYVICIFYCLFVI